uniref:Uncharacterized protein n=1 Tax=Anguilla anguilla TaxID=7936 RepID=A0A0E9R2K8_ANGAN
MPISWLISHSITFEPGQQEFIGLLWACNAAETKM